MLAMHQQRSKIANHKKSKSTISTQLPKTTHTPSTRKTSQEKARSSSHSSSEAVAKELKKQGDEGILEPVDSTIGPTTWISNLVVVPKNDPDKSPTGEIKVRLACDEWPMNKALRRTRYPIRSIEDLIYTVNGAVKFSKADIPKAFHQLKIALASIRHTTITTHRGLYRYKRLHMGISSTSEEFTEQIRKILEGLPMQLNMTDDVLVFAMTDEQHDRNLLLVLQRLEEHANGKAPTEELSHSLREATPPSNVKELRSFLGLIQCNSRFIKDTCTITEPLWNLKKKNTEWNWTEEHNLALSKLKDSITNSWHSLTKNGTLNWSLTQVCRNWRSTRSYKPR
ncbi:unnamed protein product [Brachionus calyciflorus]|uniref:Reverse transcriptase domain-containing protein n=1 Tax=Brachionus calyciflorus TaxID=104777 RepID=A0A813ZYH5_9BILA|nr:unnamed protein product [Brachionus calyciflorus]